MQLVIHFRRLYGFFGPSSPPTDFRPAGYRDHHRNESDIFTMPSANSLSTCPDSVRCAEVATGIRNRGRHRPEDRKQQESQPMQRHVNLQQRSPRSSLTALSGSGMTCSAVWSSAPPYSCCGVSVTSSRPPPLGQVPPDQLAPQDQRREEHTPFQRLGVLATAEQAQGRSFIATCGICSPKHATAIVSASEGLNRPYGSRLRNPPSGPRPSPAPCLAYHRCIDSGGLPV